VSIGTAGVLGLADVVQRDPPTTAYLMIGDRCRRNCAFCAQARTSQARANALSRVIWPPYDAADTIARLASAHQEGRLRRACLQVTATPNSLARAEEIVARIRAASGIPISASVALRHWADAARLFAAGANRLALALDAATPELFERLKAPGWQRQCDLLAELAERFPGRISTHLIVGLGETEADLVQRFGWLAARGICIGLFAFTPVPGTALADRPPPALASYRRVQAARYLITQGQLDAGQMCFSPAGQIVSYGMPPQRLAALLGSGEAFRTAGCPGCNRPYYNERPGGVMYNYPRPLTPREAEEAVATVQSGLETDDNMTGSARDAAAPCDICENHQEEEAQHDRLSARSPVHQDT